MSEQTSAPETGEPTTNNPVFLAPPAAAADPQRVEQASPPAAMSEGKEGEEFKSEDSKRAVLADLANERDRRRSAEARARDAERVADERVAAEVPKAVTAALREHLVALHGISKDDADLMLTATDPETLLKQVARMVAGNADAPTTPRPDPSQGHKGDPPALNSDRLEQSLRTAVGADRPRR
jgi:hypothetical protein